MRIALKRIDLPRFSERIRGITLPVDGVMHAFGYKEVFELDLNNSSFEVLDAEPYAFADAHADFLGVSDHDPLLVVGTSKVSYVFDPTKDSQVVQLISHGQQHDIEVRTLSGDWFIASLTSDEAYLVIAEPYLLEVYRLTG
jgi:hypothetical protein